MIQALSDVVSLWHPTNIRNRNALESSKLCGRIAFIALLQIAALGTVWRSLSEERRQYSQLGMLLITLLATTNEMRRQINAQTAFIVHNLRHGFAYDKIGIDFVAAKPDAVRSLTEDPQFLPYQGLFVQTLASKSAHFALALLENGKVNPLVLSQDQQFEIWTHVKDIQVARVMIEKGFNINVQKNGISFFEHALKKQLLPQTIFCLMLGAERPVEEVIARIRQQNRLMDQIFAQEAASKEPEFTLPTIRFSLFDLRTSPFEIDPRAHVFECEKSFGKRVGLFVSAISAAIIAYRLFYPVPQPSFSFKLLLQGVAAMSLGVVTLVTALILASKPTLKKLNGYVIQSFKNRFVPPEVCRHVIGFDTAFKLAKPEIDIHKLDEGGKTLFWHLCKRRRFFTVLAKEFFVNIPLQKSVDYFCTAVDQGSWHNVKYLLDNQIPGATTEAKRDFNRLFLMWHPSTPLNSSMSDLLQNYGLEPHFAPAPHVPYVRQPSRRAQRSGL